MAHKTKESRKKKRKRKRKNPPAVSTPSCLTRQAAPFPIKFRIPSANSRIRCQRNKSKTFTKETELFVIAAPGFFF
jgi:hypothetical protein